MKRVIPVHFSRASDMERLSLGLEREEPRERVLLLHVQQYGIFCTYTNILPNSFWVSRTYEIGNKSFSQTYEIGNRMPKNQAPRFLVEATDICVIFFFVYNDLHHSFHLVHVYKIRVFKTILEKK